MTLRGCPQFKGHSIHLLRIAEGRRKNTQDRQALQSGGVKFDSDSYEDQPCKIASKANDFRIASQKFAPNDGILMMFKKERKAGTLTEVLFTKAPEEETARSRQISSYCSPISFVGVFRSYPA